MFFELKQRCFEANKLLVKYGLVVLTWGNVSVIDRESGIIAIKPSGVSYDTMTSDDMVLVRLDGSVIGDALRPSSDTPTHLELYRCWSDIGAVVHTHSSFAVSWAQAGRDVPAYGTTHADFAPGGIPCMRALSEAEVTGEYEFNTGKVIADEFSRRGLDPSAYPATLVHRHGPFAWGKTEIKAVENALILEEVCRMAFQTELIASQIKNANIGIEDYLLNKHYQRKHGTNAYYGQGR